jgi:hypothetical protein
MTQHNNGDFNNDSLGEAMRKIIVHEFIILDGVRMLFRRRFSQFYVESNDEHHEKSYFV